MDPIPPATFYGNLMSTPGSDAMIDPVLLGNTTNVSYPPSTTVSALPVAPPLRSTLESMGSTARKGPEEFSLKDLEQLLCVVIDINPYGTAQQDRINPGMGGSKSKQLLSLNAQELTYMHPGKGGKKTSVCSPLGGELGRDPLAFALLSGKLDAIQHLKQIAKDTCEEEREQAKEGEKASQAAGESLRLGMMTGRQGHTKRACRPASSNSDSGKENHTRLSPRTPESGCVGSKQTHLTSLSHANTSKEIAKMDWVLEMHDCVIQMQERTSNMLLDRLRQGLLNVKDVNLRTLYHKGTAEIDQ
ncbi:hypothetical protein JB92DRAFT_3119206 [Gautieria morchelliformis]|nr:hypothetical protein JB92DRAFT_3119206 [Gautieria morchelliformis]